MSNMYGRQVVLTLTNKSGGGVVAGDVVIIDTANDSAFTTTTTGRAEVSVGVAQETIASNATGRVLISGSAALVNVPASVTRGHYVETHTVVKQATGSSTRRSGSFGQFLTGGTTPSAVLWGQTDQTASGSSSFVGAKAYSSATQGSISATTMTKVTLNAEEYDTSTFHDNATNNTRMTVPSTGYYLIQGYIYGGTTASRIILANFLKNDTTVLRGQVRYDATANAVAIDLLATASLSASDYIEMRVWCSGADLTLGDATNIEQQCWMSVTLLGS